MVFVRRKHGQDRTLSLCELGESSLLSCQCYRQENNRYHVKWSESCDGQAKVGLVKLVDCDCIGDDSEDDD